MKGMTQIQEQSPKGKTAFDEEKLRKTDRYIIVPELMKAIGISIKE